MLVLGLELACITQHLDLALVKSQQNVAGEVGQDHISKAMCILLLSSSIGFLPIVYLTGQAEHLAQLLHGANLSSHSAMWLKCGPWTDNSSCGVTVRKGRIDRNLMHS